MTYIYYVDGKRFTTDDYDDIPRYKISSPDENTPAFENSETKYKRWVEKGNRWHRLTGPAIIRADGSYVFWLNDEIYINVEEWLKFHPNKDNTFQVEMFLKYS